MADRNLLVEEVIAYFTEHPDEPLEDVIIQKFPQLTFAEFDLLGDHFRAVAMREATDG